MLSVHVSVVMMVWKMGYCWGTAIQEALMQVPLQDCALVRLAVGSLGRSRQWLMVGRGRWHKKGLVSVGIRDARPGLAEGYKKRSTKGIRSLLDMHLGPGYDSKADESPLARAETRGDNEGHLLHFTLVIMLDRLWGAPEGTDNG